MEKTYTVYSRRDIASKVLWILAFGVLAVALVAGCNNAEPEPINGSDPRPAPQITATSVTTAPDPAIGSDARAAPTTTDASDAATVPTPATKRPNTPVPPDGAKRVTYTLVDKTRLADLILIGKVSEVRGSSLRVEIQNGLKGTNSISDLELMWNTGSMGGLPPSTFAAGQQILLFANIDNGVFEPFAGLQGILALQPGWAGQYQAVIQKIQQFESSPSLQQRNAVLLQMLKMQNRLAQLSALQVLYLEGGMRDIPVSQLIPPIAGLAGSSDPSIAVYSVLVLGATGEKSVVPVLIGLLESPYPQTADRADKELQRLTRTNVAKGFGIRQAQPERAKAAQAWRDWWEKNKDLVELSK